MPLTFFRVVPPHPALRATFYPPGRRGSALRLCRSQPAIGSPVFYVAQHFPQTPSSPQRGEGGPKGRMRGFSPSIPGVFL